MIFAFVGDEIDTAIESSGPVVHRTDGCVTSYREQQEGVAGWRLREIVMRPPFSCMQFRENQNVTKESHDSFDSRVHVTPSEEL
jgi:hypothetical protein